MTKSIIKRSAVLFFLLLVFYFAYNYYATHQGKYKRYEVFTKNSLHGMVISSPVEMLGIEVGSVEQIELLKPRLARVVFSVDKKTPMTDRIKAKIITKGLSGKGFTGYVFIDLAEYPDTVKTFMPPIATRYQALGLVSNTNDSLDRQFGNITDDLNLITTTVTNLFDDKTIGKTHQLISHLGSVSQMFAENNRKMNLLITNMASVSSNLSPLTRTMNSTVSTLESQLLPQIHNTLSILQQLAKNANITVEKVKADPSIVIRGAKTKPLGPGEKRRS